MKKNWKPALTQGGLSLLLSWGLVFPCLFTLGIDAHWKLALGIPAAMAAVLTGLSLIKWASLIVPAVLVAWQAVSYVTAGAGVLPILLEVGRAILLFFAGQNAALPLYALEATIALSVLTAFVCFHLCHENAGFYPVLAVYLAVIMVLWLASQQSLMAYTLPALCTLVILYARDQHEGLRMRWLAPLAAVLVGLAFLITPAEGIVFQPLKDTADRIRQAVYDYFFFTEPRNVFSLAAEGYYPKGSSQLGGAAEPSDRPVMQVAAPGKVYLRGTVMDEYTGRMWLNSTGGRRYQYIYPQWRALREQLFDMGLPQGEHLLASGVFTPATVQVKMINASASTLFVPQRVRQLNMRSGDMVPYFNSASELFITRDLAPEDEYAVTAPLLLGGTPGMDKILAACQQNADPAYADIAAAYTALPSHMEEAVFELAHSMTADAQTPYEKALAIQNYLSRYYRYTLTPEEMPNNVDFVSYFLLRGKEGYCTYFASAMTVLCRMAGLPARYVEGYLAVPEANGVAYVTGLDGHAWTEIYFPGFGWLTFDATPRQTENSEDSQQPEGENEPTPPPQEPETSPEPTPEPTPDPTPDPITGETPPPETPAPEVTEPDPPEEEPLPSEPPVPPEEENPPKASLPWWVWLILVVIAAAALRIVWTLPSLEARRLKNIEGKAMAWTQAVYDLMYLKGLKPNPGETPLQFAKRVDDLHVFEPLVTPLCQTLSLSRYSRHPLSDEDLAIASGTFGALWQEQPWHMKARHILYRAAMPRKKIDFTKR